MADGDQPVGRTCVLGGGATLTASFGRLWFPQSLYLVPFTVILTTVLTVRSLKLLKGSFLADVLRGRNFVLCFAYPQSPPCPHQSRNETTLLPKEALELEGALLYLSPRLS